ncbi:MAG: glycosyltransferase [Pseudonocardiales bacterium]|nr:glycosyltransferase [Pseudonocardiales bacterium]MBV9031914.1 glycosyltransferase [Pseudonocardiales bacterium]
MTTAGHQVTRVGVVVPAHNEEELLPRCLAALRCAAVAVDIPVHLLVVLDACSDRTADAAGDAEVLAVWERNVGAARRAGFAHLLHELGADRVWLASTDADSQVPKGWLADQLAHARHGADAVAGMVCVCDWSEHPPITAERFRRLHHHVIGHRHVHGANLGISARSYLAVDGFPTLPAHEDVALVTTLKRTGHRVLHAADPPVITSARRRARATEGFADFLIRLAEHDPGRSYVPSRHTRVLGG